MKDTPVSVPAATRGPDWARIAPAALAAICFSVLGFAFFVEFAFGYEPCSLCTYQRLAYAGAGIVALAALAARNVPKLGTGLLALCGIVLLAGGGVAFYHVGVEHHWWGSAFCAGGAADLSTDNLRAALSAPAEKPCDEVDWTLFGLSMATYNVGIMLVLGGAALAAARAAKARSRP